ncbi:MAG: N-methyl-D-aspartate receptor NMDAR2C subunit [Fibrobacteres bacterium]|nr:N-methyl-D-aspartate receptor NMDAR2C subunit [Fibrobacterota bacterium]
MSNDNGDLFSRLRAMYFGFLGSMRLAQDPSDSFGYLVSRYSEPHRKYHNLSHIQDCLAKFDSMRDLTENDMAVELAIWFHDIVYDPFSRTNEEDSAETFRAVMAPYALSEVLCRTVCDLILSTRHVSAPETIDAAVLHDVDLSILGSESDAYLNYCRCIREEYSGYADDPYREGRAQFLRKMLGMEWIYCTAHGRDRYEPRARQNLVRELALLQGLS